MCGIVGSIGKHKAYSFLIKGLQRLEYRGYDSAGVAIIDDDEINVFKKKGKVRDLQKFIGNKNVNGNIGIGHTRWATHGVPNDVNSHPHKSGNGHIAIIHNGIIENYDAIKKALILRGHIFQSDTDTEVLAHFIEEIQTKENLNIESAVRQALSEIEGAYAIAVIDDREPDKIIAARLSSPLVIGIGENDLYIASDASPLVEYTKKVVYLKDKEMAILNLDGMWEVKNFDNVIQKSVVKEIELSVEALEKGDFDTFMLKEIHEQPTTIANCMRGRVNASEGWIKLNGVELNFDALNNADRIIIAAAGTSWHAGLIGEYLIEELARIPVEVEYASELRYRNPIVKPNDVLIAVSQSGETADTLAAMKHVKSKGGFLYGIVNVVSSSIARLSDTGTYIHCGQEIGVASTKAFTGQVTVLTMIAIYLGFKRGTIPQSYYLQLIEELENIPSKIQQILEKSKTIEYIASEIKDASNAIFLGRGYNFPIALEGALKLKEISYVHAEGYPAAEMKHGPIALIDENMPVIVIATNKSSYDKVVSNIQEVKARKGVVVAIVVEGDTIITKLADYTIKIPKTDEPLTPLLSVIPLQLLSYYIARMRGCNVDQPRNLAKSVTVE